MDKLLRNFQHWKSFNSGLSTKSNLFSILFEQFQIVRLKNHWQTLFFKIRSLITSSAFAEDKLTVVAKRSLILENHYQNCYQSLLRDQSLPDLSLIPKPYLHKFDPNLPQRFVTAKSTHDYRRYIVRPHRLERQYDGLLLWNQDSFN